MMLFCFYEIVWPQGNRVYTLGCPITLYFVWSTLCTKYSCLWYQRRCLGPRRGVSGLKIPRASWCLGKKGEHKGKYRKHVKVNFKDLNFIWGDFKPQKWIPGKILILLDPHNLSVRQILPKYYISIFAICHCHLPFLASLKMANFDVQISYGGLEVSEFYQESISEVKSLIR